MVFCTWTVCPVLHSHQAILSSEDILLTDLTTQPETQQDTDYTTIIANLLNRTQPEKMLRTEMIQQEQSFKKRKPEVNASRVLIQKYKKSERDLKLQCGQFLSSMAPASQPPNPQRVLPCLLRAYTTSMAVTVLRLACSVQVTASRMTFSRKTCRKGNSELVHNQTTELP